MSEKIRDVMTRDPATCRTDDTASDAARAMRDGDFGAVVVVSPESEEVRGIVTDRDIVVRCVAEGGDTRQAKVGDVCTSNLTTVPADATLQDAARIMRDQALRRLPVVDRGKPVGIVSLGDLAVEADPSSALGGISAASPNE